MIHSHRLLLEKQVAETKRLQNQGRVKRNWHATRKKPTFRTCMPLRVRGATKTIDLSEPPPEPKPEPPPWPRPIIPADPVLAPASATTGLAAAGGSCTTGAKSAKATSMADVLGKMALQAADAKHC